MNIFLKQFKNYLKNLKLKDEIIDDVINQFDVKYYKKNQCFSIAGTLNNRLGFIISGLFYMYTIKEDGSCYTKDFISKNQFLLAVFDPARESTVSIKSIKESIVLEARYSDILKLFEKYSDFNELGKRGMEKKLEYLYDKLEQMATMEAGDRYEIFKNKYGKLEKDIPQYLVASYIGVTPTQLSRLRKNIN